MKTLLSVTYLVIPKTTKKNKKSQNLNQTIPNSFLKKSNNDFIQTHQQPRLYLQSLNLLRLHSNLFPSQTPKSQPQETANGKHRAHILKEERKIEREIIKAITVRKLNSLKPNLGQFVPIGEHYMCVSYHEESDSNCRVWEWHRHMVFYDDENAKCKSTCMGTTLGE